MGKNFLCRRFPLFACLLFLKITNLVGFRVLNPRIANLKLRVKIMPEAQHVAVERHPGTGSWLWVGNISWPQCFIKAGAFQFAPSNVYLKNQGNLGAGVAAGALRVLLAAAGALPPEVLVAAVLRSARCGMAAELQALAASGVALPEESALVVSALIEDPESTEQLLEASGESQDILYVVSARLPT